MEHNHISSLRGTKQSKIISISISVEELEKYESEMLTETLVNLYFITPKNEENKLRLIKNILIKRGLNTDDFNESFYINNIIRLFPTGWSEVGKEMFKELQNNDWSINLPLEISIRDTILGVSLDGGMSLDFYDIGKGKPNQILDNIIEDFEYKFNHTCSNCGEDNAKLDYNFWVILCDKCSKLDTLNRDKPRND